MDKLAFLLLFASFLSCLGYAEWVDKVERAEAAAREANRFHLCNHEAPRVAVGSLSYCASPRYDLSARIFTH